MVKGNFQCFSKEKFQQQKIEAKTTTKPATVTTTQQTIQQADSLSSLSLASLFPGLEAFRGLENLSTDNLLDFIYKKIEITPCDEIKLQIKNLIQSIFKHPASENSPTDVEVNDDVVSFGNSPRGIHAVLDQKLKILNNLAENVMIDKDDLFKILENEVN